MTEKVLKIIVSALMKEFVVDNVEDLLILLAQKGIKITIQVASDLYYNYQWNNRKQLPYTPLNNNHIVVPATSVKDKEKNKYCWER